MSVFPFSSIRSQPAPARPAVPRFPKPPPKFLASTGMSETAEARRLRALELKRDGWQQSEIATELDVTPGAVSQWMRRAREEGAEGLRSRRNLSGARPRLMPEQWERIGAMLSEGPQVHGLGEIDDDGNWYWTVKDVACLIERMFGVHYHPSHVGRVLKQRGIERL